MPALRRALEQGDAPTLRSLAERDGWTLRPLYPGMPSTTPAVQGELFYGVRSRVPAFAYFDRERAEAVHFMDPASADGVERSIEHEGPALLDGGTGYCNIYVGGAAEARFCPAGLARTQEAIRRPLRRQLRALAAYAGVAVRSVTMMGGELVRLLLGGRHTGGARFRVRANDAWHRIVASVALRDMSRVGALHDIKRDAPVTLVNFVGYDKQAHRYGPRSRPAMRALSGIDTAIRSLLEASERRDRIVVVYSDHGQEATTPVEEVAGARIETLVREATEDAPLEDSAGADERRSIAAQARLALQRLREELGEALVGISSTGPEQRSGGPVTIQSGPLAHVYGLGALPASWRERIATRLAGRAPGLVAIWRDDDGTAHAALRDERFDDIDDLCERLVEDHPFRDRVAQDFPALFDHHDAGDLVLIATGFDERAMTFAGERGSHGGPGPVETHAFVLAPDDLGIDAEAPRPLDLRRALLRLREDDA